VIGALPTSHKKLTTEGTPCTSLPEIGLVIDTVRIELRLDMVRLMKLHAGMAGWSQRHTAAERAIQSLLGVLNFEAKNVLPGRLFLRRMTDLHQWTSSAPKATSTGGRVSSRL
jgi:hypothetical protein